jgi:hypothetical protein
LIKAAESTGTGVQIVLYRSAEGLPTRETGDSPTFLTRHAPGGAKAVQDPLAGNGDLGKMGPDTYWEIFDEPLARMRSQAASG